MTKRILFIVGSQRQGSFNHQLAQLVEGMLEELADVSYLDYSQIPLFNQDLETPVLPAVAKARESVMAADAIWIFSPTYNHSIPGVVKNLLDWLSRALDLSETRGESALHNKIITVSSVANGNSPDNVFADYRKLLPFIRTQVVEPFTGVPINPEAWESGKLNLDTEKEQALKEQVAALIETIH